MSLFFNSLSLKLYTVSQNLIEGYIEKSRSKK